MFKNLITKIKDFILYKENDAHEFQPILAEIEDRPMNPLGNTIFWLVVSFLVLAALWMYFGKVDIVITARGTIIPDGEEKVVQSLDKGVIQTINVLEGDYVQKGQVLAVIIPSEDEPKLEMNNLREEQRILNETIKSKQYDLAIAQDKKKRLNEVMDLIPKSRYDEALTETSNLSHDIAKARASLSEISNRMKQIDKQTQIIKAPVNGTVNKIMIHTIGGVVTPAEQLMTIIPDDTPIKIKATVMNQDIGFVETDMPVSIKVDTYNFQKYGILNGKVTVVGSNSIKDERLGEVYEVYVKPLNSTLMVEGKEQSIKVGMTTTNEIKIGKRRIIEFFIYPLIKYLDESIKVQ
ncbi:MAG: HlyD family efflux transporter periplasmic adaptor subunit [bacterium]|nr:HlyD family efflux transporter periplasmic adaptor subunit [bacterium]